ncbi:MAG: glycosyltransferase family 8 protein [Rhizobiaceae bacterium]|nr:glycosyltransferase family 8 protein [Rhizobiaceae bacterium]
MKSVVALACDDNFIPYASVVARRIAMLSSADFPIVIVSDGVSEANKKLAREFCPKVSFIEASFLLDGKNLPVHGSFSRAAHLRLFLDEILSDFRSAVYIDSDVSVLVDVAPLLEVMPRNGPIAATHDIPITIGGQYRSRLGMDAPYLNSGLMVMDLQAIRSDGIFVDTRQYASTYPERCFFVDQDPLNAVLDGRWQVLDWRWNVLSHFTDRLPGRPFLRHFAGYKPWAKKKVGIEKRFVDEWRTDLLESPWPDRFHEQSLKYPIRQTFRRLLSTGYMMMPGMRPEGDSRWLRYSKALVAAEQSIGAVAVPLFAKSSLQSLTQSGSS